MIKCNFSILVNILNPYELWAFVACKKKHIPTKSKLNFTKYQQKTVMVLMTKSYCERSVHYLSGVINLFLYVSADIIAVYITYMYFLYLCEKM